jgi:hypothetical protein
MLRVLGLAKCYILQDIKLIISLAYYLKKLFLLARRISEIKRKNAIIKRDYKNKECYIFF